MRGGVGVHFHQGVDLAASVGDAVRAAGNTGISTGPHLHYGESVNGAWRDPTYSPGGCSSSSSGGSAPFVPLPSPLPALPNPSALLANLPGRAAAALPIGILAVLFAVAYDELS